jgi:outer membrane protein OmpA-like peptidoglycan-associated protein
MGAGVARSLWVLFLLKKTMPTLFCHRSTAAPWLLTLSLFVFGSSTLFSQSDWLVEKLPDSINSAYDEIAPVPTRDGRTLFFTRVAYPEFDRTLIFDTIDYAKKLPEDKYRDMLRDMYTQLGQRPYGDPSQSFFNQDVWVSEADSAYRFSKSTHPPYPLNNALPNSLVAITPDPRAFYIINRFKPEGDMKRGFSVIRRQDDGSWSFPEPVEIKDYYTITSEVNLTMSFDGNILILSAARFDSRSTDLYVCFREGRHQWSSPKHMGNVVNSEKREITPFLSEDNRTLFFASNRHGQALDLFFTRREDDTWTKWSPPVELVAPINSPSDESQPYFNMSSGYLYFASKRAGSSDLFRVRIAPPQPTEILIKGRVINAKTRAVMSQSQVRYGPKGQETESLSAADGTFSLRIPKGLTFDLCAQKIGFLGKPDTLLFRHDYYYFQDYYTIDLLLSPLEVGDTIAMPPIYFQQSKAVILETSLAELDVLYETLQINPALHIRIEGHSDNVGKIEDLVLLSQQRADSIRDFLIKKGITAQRIETIGHGPKFPISKNDSEEARRQNRRVEFIITKS